MVSENRIRVPAADPRGNPGSFPRDDGGITGILSRKSRMIYLIEYTLV